MENLLKNIQMRHIIQMFTIITSLFHYSQTNTAQNEIKEITFDKSLLEPDGTFTEQSLPKFLAQAYQEKKLTNPDFSKEECLKAKKMDVQGSFNTLQLFQITSTCRQTSPASIYIIKEAKNGLGEATKLQAVAKYPGMKELLAPATPPKGFPSVILPIAYFSYAGPGGYGLHYIAVMPSAKGKVFCQVVQEYRDNQSPQNAEKLKQTYKILGAELANFHKRFNHGDLHCFNMFYNGEYFGLIDNETITTAKGLQSASDDNLKLFLGLASTSEPAERKNIIQGIDLKTWYNLAFKSFIEGYLDAYQSADQLRVMQELKKMFNNNQAFPWLKIDSAELQKLRTSYINPVFDEIEKQRFAKK
jgi:hypothetical protein